jgi:hypothetical protein
VQTDKEKNINKYTDTNRQTNRKGHSETKTQTQIEVQRDQKDRQKQKEIYTNGEKQTQIQRDIGKE